MTVKYGKSEFEGKVVEIKEGVGYNNFFSYRGIPLSFIEMTIRNGSNKFKTFKLPKKDDESSILEEIVEAFGNEKEIKFNGEVNTTYFKPTLSGFFGGSFKPLRNKYNGKLKFEENEYSFSYDEDVEFKDRILGFEIIKLK